MAGQQSHLYQTIPLVDQHSSRPWKSRLSQLGIMLFCIIIGACLSMLLTNRSVSDNGVVNNPLLKSFKFPPPIKQTPAELAGSPSTDGVNTWTLGGPDPRVIKTSLPKVTSLDDLPKNWDWRHVDLNNTGVYVSLLTPVLNQMVPKSCGSCWAFGTASSISDRIRIATYKKYGRIDTPIVLSVQALLDCGMTSFGSCHGGDPRYALKWIYENGLVDETCNPYIASHPSWSDYLKPCGETQCHTCELDGTCHVVDNPVKYYISEFSTLNATTLAEFELEAMNEIYHRGPIIVSMYSMSPEYRNYKGGYVLRDSTQYPVTTHVVSLVGWGVTDDGLKYWIVRNSDGVGWGEQGFFRAERGVNTYNLEIHGAWGVPIV